MPNLRVEVWDSHAPSPSRGDNDATTGRLYFLRGRDLDTQSVERLCRELLSDPVTERFAISDLIDKWFADKPGFFEKPGLSANPLQSQSSIEITFLPGVTDSAAENLIRAAHLLGIGVDEAATGTRIVFKNALPEHALRTLAKDKYANEVVQQYAINQPITPPFITATQTHAQDSATQVEVIALKDATDNQLLAISKARRLALDLAEMQSIRRYYAQEKRDPTDVELEMLAQTWSEHCVHKTFRAMIEVANGERVNGLLKTYIRAATEKLNKPWVKSAFVDNAGIIEFDDDWDVAFKVETHNHPSALEPFGGANTGLGGVIRDVLGVSARPIANTDVLCFGYLESEKSRALPSGVLHPQRVFDGVVKGIEDYGNKMGIPTVNGAIYFHEGYTANPLVFAGCVGLLPKAQTVSKNDVKKAQHGDLIVAIGGRTGRDGLRGATFSSMEMDTTTSNIAGSAVQIGHPIHEKQTQEAILQARDANLYSAITDCGAGGFSSAVGEMASGLGATVQLKNVLLKYAGLQPWEIWLSEAQERMVLAVPPQNWNALKTICAGQDIEAFVLGTFENSGRVTLCYGAETVGNLDVHFLHEGIPQRQLKAEIGDWRLEATPQSLVPHHQPLNLTQSLLALLAHPNICSKENVVRRYDHEVKGQTAVKPFVGVAGHGPSDAAVIVPQGSTSNRAIALANGLCPQFTTLDPYAMAWAAIDEAVRNAVAVGADPDHIAILDNFCWGNPNLPDRLGSLVETARGCHDAALAYGTPFISGKDSLNNEYTDSDGTKHAIPGTLLVSAIGIVPNLHRTITMDLKSDGNFLFILGETKDELGGSHYALVNNDNAHAHSGSPQPVPNAVDGFRALHQAIASGLVTSCHDCSEGGMAVALAEMCLAGRLGAEIDLRRVPLGAHSALSNEVILFSESLSRFMVEIAPEHVAAFEQHMQNTPCAEIGRVWDDDVLRIYGTDGSNVVWAEVDKLERAFKGEGQKAEGKRQKEEGEREGEKLEGRSKKAEGERQKSEQIISHKRVLVLHANGSNRDHDAAAAIALAGGTPDIVHVNELLQGTRDLLNYHMLVLPGGFSFGDDLGSGVIWSALLRQQLGEPLRKFVASGRPVLGICNGFQALVKAGLFEESGHTNTPARTATLTFNQQQHFECRWVWLEVNRNSPCLFTKGTDDLIYCPVAHGEGRFRVSDETTLNRLKANQQITLSYSGVGYPSNPNGSDENIAGICNAAGNVMGLMPHPENHIHAWQHPRWHRGERGQTGLALFANGLKNA